ncbi:MAG: DUF4124 domain-containing protein [Gammaproteobacteria bacterium]|nr:DUF4124 domain-containing protein [Gammaproteobacteria bacterium]
MNRRFSLIALAGLLIVTSSPAEIYRWVDQRGKVHFSDRPKNGAAQKFKIVEPESEPGDIVQESVQAEQKVQRQRLLDAYREDREAEKQKRQHAEVKERQRAGKCADARNQLRTYESSRLYKTLENGERRYLNSGERQQELDLARAAVTRWCSS